jgi:hypothetical protein
MKLSPDCVFNTLFYLPRTGQLVVLVRERTGNHKTGRLYWRERDGSDYRPVIELPPEHGVQTALVGTDSRLYFNVLRHGENGGLDWEATYRFDGVDRQAVALVTKDRLAAWVGGSGRVWIADLIGADARSVFASVAEQPQGAGRVRYALRRLDLEAQSADVVSELPDVFC